MIYRSYPSAATGISIYLHYEAKAGLIHFIAEPLTKFFIMDLSLFQCCLTTAKTPLHLTAEAGYPDVG